LQACFFLPSCSPSPRYLCQAFGLSCLNLCARSRTGGSPSPCFICLWFNSLGITFSGFCFGHAAALRRVKAYEPAQTFTLSCRVCFSATTASRLHVASSPAAFSRCTAFYSVFGTDRGLQTPVSATFFYLPCAFPFARTCLLACCSLHLPDVLRRHLPVGHCQRAARRRGAARLWLFGQREPGTLRAVQPAADADRRTTTLDVPANTFRTPRSSYCWDVATRADFQPLPAIAAFTLPLLPCRWVSPAPCAQHYMQCWRTARMLPGGHAGAARQLFPCVIHLRAWSRRTKQFILHSLRSVSGRRVRHRTVRLLNRHQRTSLHSQGIYWLCWRQSHGGRGTADLARFW